MELSRRQEQILKAIVDQYIATAHPVGSSSIASDMEVSPATIRNEMAVLEEMDLIGHLHTSGGRVPTNGGYRYYVERLMPLSAMPSSEARTIRHQFHQAHTDVQEWLKLAAIVMARRMHNVGLVTAPKSTEERLRHLEVIATQPNVALLIVVLQDGTVLQEMCGLAEPQSQEELSSLAAKLNGILQGFSAQEIEGKAPALAGTEANIARVVARLVKRGEEQNAQLYHAGLPELMSQPEFMGPRPGESMIVLNERLRQMVDFLQQGMIADWIVSGLTPLSGVRVVVGSETARQPLDDYSFVLGRYGETGDTSGYVGIVGPTRMEYPRAVALVRYMSDLMTDLMQAL